MKWLTRGTSHLSAPYYIHNAIRGYEIWMQKDGKYGVLKRELPTLNEAKAYAEQHAAKQPI